MKNPTHCSGSRTGGKLLLLAGMLAPGLLSGQTAQVSNPIGQMARLFNSRLVQIEDRVHWLDERISTLAPFQEHIMKTALGTRCGRLNPGDADPAVTLDLGSARALDTIFLIPAQRELTSDGGLFPKRFTLELSNDPGFADRTVIYSSGTTPYPSPEGKPVRFMAHNTPARYIRLTVQQGHAKGVEDIFALSELIAISDGQPVSFGAQVTTTGGIEIPGIWSADHLTDSRMPLGIWQSGQWSENRGDIVEQSGEAQPISWSLPLEAPAKVDRVLIFPYQLAGLPDSGIIPDTLTLHVTNADGAEEELVHEWRNPLAGSNHLTPLLIPLDGREVKNLRITGTSPWKMGDRSIYALSEIQVWRGKDNLAESRPVTRTDGTGTSETATLTDGFASERHLISVEAWLGQLHERWRNERELAVLRPIRQQMAAESELNATWGSAVMLGLTFLIPVVIVERRRLISKNQLDQLRKRIASDLHDDIGSNLGSISLIARTAKKDLIRLHGPEVVAEDLGEVESIARESSLAMRDIVWLLERKQDSIGDLVRRMRETASRMLRELDYSIECESSKTAAKLSLDAKRHLFLFYKEAVHNVLKHSRATKVGIRLWDEGDHLVMEVRDNGIGLPLDPAKRPTVVNKLEDRARVLDGHLHIESTAGAGTALKLVVKRARLIARPSLP